MKRSKTTNKLFKNVLRALPAIPFIARSRRRASVAPFILGAVGAAIGATIAAIMIFSPRTRYRALDIAKDRYGKVRGQLGQLGIAEKLGMSHRERATAPDYSSGYSSETAGGI